jgi:cytochrome c-type biogenesis protein CcmF
MTTMSSSSTRGRARGPAIEGEGPVHAFAHLIQRNRRRYGGYIVHAGLVIMFMGFAGAAYDVEKQVTLSPARARRSSPFGHTYRLTYQDMSWYTATNMTKVVASMQVERNGRPVGVLTAEQRFLPAAAGDRDRGGDPPRLERGPVPDPRRDGRHPNGVVRGTNPRPVATFRSWSTRWCPGSGSAG